MYVEHRGTQSRTVTCCVGIFTGLYRYTCQAQHLMPGSMWPASQRWVKRLLVPRACCVIVQCLMVPVAMLYASDSVPPLQFQVWLGKPCFMFMGQEALQQSMQRPAWTLLQALRHMHKLGVIHRDCRGGLRNGALQDREHFNHH